MVKPTSVALGIGLASYTLGAACLKSDFNSSIDSDKTQKLNIISKYLKNYQGTNINLALLSARDNIQAINYDGKSSELKQLENKIQEVGKNLEAQTDYYIHKSAINSLGQDIQDLANDKGKTGYAAFGAFFFGTLGTILIGTGLYHRNKDSDSWYKL